MSQDTKANWGPGNIHWPPTAGTVQSLFDRLNEMEKEIESLRYRAEKGEKLAVQVLGYGGGAMCVEKLKPLARKVLGKGEED